MTLQMVPSPDGDLLSISEKNYLVRTLPNGRLPNLNELWALMDAAWTECSCDQGLTDDRMGAFYSHPVWLLNGLFAEHDAESQDNRRRFSDFVATLGPHRVAEIGGGYGTLARMIGRQCTTGEVHVVEPHPHAIAASLAQSTPNVRFVSDLSGSYDVMVATDVYEHIPDPLSLVHRTAEHLRDGGTYLIANCFLPVIQCHLPSTFHFRRSWDAALAAMNLRPGQVVHYGRAYVRTGDLDLGAARVVERRSQRWHGVVERLHPRLRERFANLLWRREV